MWLYAHTELSCICNLDNVTTTVLATRDEQCVYDYFVLHLSPRIAEGGRSPLLGYFN